VSSSKKRLGIVFVRFGPYHRVRIESLLNQFDVTAIELSADAIEYAWDRIDFAGRVKRVVVAKECSNLKFNQLVSRFSELISPKEIDAIAINGWAERGAQGMLYWCLRNRIPAILMSESNRMDFRRNLISEFVKRRLLTCFSAAFVAGTLSRKYVCELGMPVDCVVDGYDIIDNSHFEISSETNREEVRSKLQLPRPYFLASNRFIEKKNLIRLIDAYAIYRKAVTERGAPTLAFDLVLLGDGPLRSELISKVHGYSLAAHVHFPGFKQYEELPSYYAGASVFVHASTTEQWGLVVNEAMAAGLPVIVSSRCGCVSDLVIHGKTGLVFDPTNTNVLAEHMIRLSNNQGECETMSHAAKNLIRDWGPDRFHDGMSRAVEHAITRPIHSSLFQRATLKLICR
jgi:1,2-diacylglycerol 3-alpha-glucosyltransferase